jgi:hypothetical protein
MKLTKDVIDQPSSEPTGRSDLQVFPEKRRTTTFGDEVPPFVVCILLGLAMALLPAIIQWFKLGYMMWIGNGDELFMLALGSRAYFNHPSYLSDPVLASGGVSLFRQLPLLPGVWMAWAFGLGPLGIDVCWRILAGLSLGATWYLLVRQFVPRPWVAAALVMVLLADIGLLSTGLFLRQIQATTAMLDHSPNLVAGDFLHSQWRVATPALTMAYFLLNLWLVTRAREMPTRLSLILAGLSFGLLFHVYPYFWSAAAAALALAFLIDQGHRRVYFWTGVIGVLIGSYRLFHDMMLKQVTAKDWLVRSDKFVHVAPFADLKPPFVACLVLLIGFVWIWKKRRDLIYVWAMGVAGVVLFKHHVVTGLNIENYHWLYVWAPCCSLLFLLLLLELIPRRRPYAQLALAGLIIVCLADASLGLALRAAESTQAKAGLELVASCYDYQLQRIDSGTARFAPNCTVAGDHQFINFASILENQRPLENYWVFLSPYVTDAEWDERVALNCYLLDRDRATFDADQRQTFRLRSEAEGWGPWTRDAEEGKRRVKGRMAAFDGVVKDPDSALNRYGVRYLGLRAGQVSPAYLAKQGWVRIQEGPTWQIWERPAASGR